MQLRQSMFIEFRKAGSHMCALAVAAVAPCALAADCRRLGRPGGGLCGGGVGDFGDVDVGGGDRGGGGVLTEGGGDLAGGMWDGGGFIIGGERTLDGGGRNMGFEGGGGIAACGGGLLLDGVASWQAEAAPRRPPAVLLPHMRRA